MSMTRAWRLAAPGAEVATLAADPAYDALLRLARAANAVRFAHAVLVEYNGADSPQSRRYRINAWFHLCRALADALPLTAALRPLLRQDADTPAEFEDLLDDPGVAAFAGEVVARLAEGGRVGAALRGARPAGDPAIFAAGMGSAPGAAYYTMPDEIVIRAALDLRESGDALFEAVKEPMADTALLAERWMDAVERTIARVLRTQPWRFEG
jgi:hypothetical protein